MYAGIGDCLLDNGYDDSAKGRCAGGMAVAGHYLSVLAIVQQERKQDRTLAVISLLYAFILALFIGVIVLM